MEVYLKGKIIGYDATGEYDKDTRKLIVYKGSKVSLDISYSKTFKAAAKIAESRKETVENGIVLHDIEFPSASTAANVVTGRSTNGMIAWKTSEGKTLNEEICGYNPYF